MKLGQFFASLFALIILLAQTSASAQLVVDVTEGQKKPMNIAISDFSGPNGANIAAVVRADLTRSGLFGVGNPTGAAQRLADVNVTPRFADWRATKTEALVVGNGTLQNGRLRTEFRLWDIYGESQMLGLELVSSDVNWRRIAHKVSDAIYKRLTGKGAMFDSRVVFVAESGPRTNRIKRLAVMDSDGAEPSYLTDGTEQILSPRFSSDGQQIVYTSLGRLGMKLWVLDVETGRREAISGIGNMVFAPRFSPNGSAIIFSSERDGNTDIMVKNLANGAIHRLTDNPAIDTSPAFSPDARQIAFTSDRAGTPQIYKMNADGSGMQRLTFGQGRYSTPIWSPEGNLIAFTKQSGGQFQIGVVNIDGTGEKILASAYLVEGPSFAPNGRAIVFQKEDGPGGAPSLWTIDINGANLRPIGFNSSGSDPAWSPILD